MDDQFLLRGVKPCGVIVLYGSDRTIGKLGIGNGNAEALTFLEDVSDGLFNLRFFSLPGHLGAWTE